MHNDRPRPSISSLREHALDNSCQHKCKIQRSDFHLDLLRKIKKVYRKWNKIQPKRRRIHELAIPKYKGTKYRATLPVRGVRQIEVVKERKLSTRNEQLAFTNVRRLIATRDEVREYIRPDMYQRLNRYIHRGMYSLYSRLMNSTPPVIINPKKPWTKEEWNEHTIYLKKLAKPKKLFEPDELERPKKPLSDLEVRLELLAKPKWLPEKHVPIPIVKPSALKYVATDRIEDLSKAKPVLELPPRIPKTFRGKKFTVSDRTQQLAKHREKRIAISDAKENAFKIAPNALKARTSERTKKLALAKIYPEIKVKDPMAISPAALKAKTTKRTIELAQPRKRS